MSNARNPPCLGIDTERRDNMAALTRLLAVLWVLTTFSSGRSQETRIPSHETYDLNSNGTPRFVKSDFIELARIERISRFRSGVGHDYSDGFESCRSMKHYFQPSNTVNWASIQIRSPVAGTVSRLDQESLAGSGTQMRIKSRDFPAFYFILFHVRTNGLVSVGDSVSAGQLLGTHIGT